MKKENQRMKEKRKSKNKRNGRIIEKWKKNQKNFFFFFFFFFLQSNVNEREIKEGTDVVKRHMKQEVTKGQEETVRERDRQREMNKH